MYPSYKFTSNRLLPRPGGSRGTTYASFVESRSFYSHHVYLVWLLPEKCLIFTDERMEAEVETKIVRSTL